MKWDKSSYEKKKDVEQTDLDAKYAELGKLVYNFLRSNNTKGVGFPDLNVYIGTGYEIGGAVDDFGYGVYKLYHTTDGDKLKLLVEDKKLLTLFTKAEKVLTCSHEFDALNWCTNCKTHKTVLE